MKKKIVGFVLLFILVSCVLIGIGACTQETAEPVGSLTAEQVLAIKKAYAPKKSSRKNVTVLDDLGTYNGNIAVLLHWNLSAEGMAGSATTVNIYIGETYVGYLGDNSYKIIVYTQEETCLTLTEAYEGEYITEGDISTFVQKAQDSSYIYTE